jgi:hypothetical protein
MAPTPVATETEPHFRTAVDWATGRGGCLAHGICSPTADTARQDGGCRGSHCPLGGASWREAVEQVGGQRGFLANHRQQRQVQGSCHGVSEMATPATGPQTEPHVMTGRDQVLGDRACARKVADSCSGEQNHRINRWRQSREDRMIGAREVHRNHLGGAAQRKASRRTCSATGTARARSRESTPTRSADGRRRSRSTPSIRPLAPARSGQRTPRSCSSPNVTSSPHRADPRPGRPRQGLRVLRGPRLPR